jgi:hypothetical protein
MSSADLERVGQVVAKSKAVMHDIAHIRPVMTGTVGSSPEIYEWIDKEKGSGQVIAFSGSARRSDYTVKKIRGERVLAVVGNSYTLTRESLTIHFEFGWPDASREAFILPCQGEGMSVVSSTSWLDEASQPDERSLRFVNGAPGTHVIECSRSIGTPTVSADKEIVQKTEIVESSGKHRIVIETRSPRTDIRITGK